MITTKENYLYIGQGANLAKYTEDTLQLVGEVSFGANIDALAIDGNFIYVSSSVGTGIRKYNINTLAFVGNTITDNGQFISLSYFDNNIYGSLSARRRGYLTNNIAREQLPYYSINNISGGEQ